MKSKVNKQNSRNKKGLSEMVSYALLVSIAIIVSVGVFIWMRGIANVSPPADCKEGTSIMLEDYSCTSSGSYPGISLNLKNNGMFNVEGIILAVSNDSKRFDPVYLVPLNQPGQSPGYFFFWPLFEPSKNVNAGFKNTQKIGGVEQLVPFNEIKIIQIQPFITYKKGNKKEIIVCQDSVVRQEITGCIIK